jgi:hypothetical protein
VPIINNIVIIPKDNRTLFRAYFENISASMPDVKITYEESVYKTNFKKFNYTAICDNTEVAIKVIDKIEHGASIYSFGS